MNNWGIAISDSIESLKARVTALEANAQAQTQDQTYEALYAVCTVRTVGGSVVLSLPKDLLSTAGFQTRDKLKLIATHGKIELQMFTRRAKP